MASNLEKSVARAVRRFWRTRSNQGRAQGTSTGRRDYGNRTVATGGKQLDGFNSLLQTLLVDAGIPKECVKHGRRSEVTIPGFFRPTKQWDVLVVAEGHLLASIECKALCGPSFGNNYNNRIEEALGASTDIWTAYREGAFDASPRPFVGYLLLVEEAAGSTRPVAVSEAHFQVFAEFRDASYIRRCEESLSRFVRERSYDAACLIVSSKKAGARGVYQEPATHLAFERFANLMTKQTHALYEVVRKKPT